MDNETLKDYYDCYSCLDAKFKEVGGYEFYQDIFPNNENAGEEYTDYSHPNAVYLFRDENRAPSKRRLTRRIMLNDTWERDYMNNVEGNPMTLCSGLTYRKWSNTLENAQRMNALIFDLDGVGYNELMSLFLRFGGEPQELRRLPMPTYLVLSGTGLHVYYVFDRPIDLFPNIKTQMKSLKYDLTFRMWDYKGTSKVKAIQYQSINQGFRMVGSINNKHGNQIRAFRTGDRVSLDYVNAYADPENRVDVNKPLRPSRMTKEEAREAYPEWYERVIVNGDKKKKKTWDIAGKVHGDDPYALYHWWMKQIGKIRGGHRYFFMMCMAIYAYKCDVPKSVLKKDLEWAFDRLQNVEHDNPLNKSDVRSALEAYDRGYFNYTIEDIELLTDVRINRNKRNGRSQSKHLERARLVQTLDYPDGEWRNMSGRPREISTVIDWRRTHPDGRKIDCQRDTGLSKPTVLKWWDWSDPEEITRQVIKQPSEE